jgi:hypothetical protein
MSDTQPTAWWNQVPARIGGDMIVADIGDNATGVAVGKNITQTVYTVLGAPTPNDKQIVEQKMAEVATALQGVKTDLDATRAAMADFQLKLLGSELAKTEEEETPSASTIVQIGDWLLDNVPQIAEVITGLFATPAVGRVVGKAGEVAVAWLKKRFGRV